MLVVSKRDDDGNTQVSINHRLKRTVVSKRFCAFKYFIGDIFEVRQPGGQCVDVVRKSRMDILKMN